jgi:hypothetical protein
MAVLVPNRAMADEPLSPPSLKTIWTSNRQFCAVMDPQSMITSVYQVSRSGQRTRHWAMYGWFRVAHLADDGKHLVAGHPGVNLVPLDVRKDDVMAYFFRRGELVNSVTLGQLLRDLSRLERTASHYHWGNYLGINKNGSFVIETVDGSAHEFDVTTGRDRGESRR